MTVIGAKAFLSCRQVEELVLPDSLEQVEDWAFAHMKGLKVITFPARKILFGKKVFLGCDGLRRVMLACRGEPLRNQYEGMPYFLASSFRFAFDSIQGGLSDLGMAGDTERQWQWLSLYDEALSVFLMRADDYGFEPAFIGWFDVEDVDDQKEEYIKGQRRKKITLVFQRLFYPGQLSGQTEKLLRDYLTRKVPEQVLGLMWDVDSGYGRDVKYFQVWRQIGGFTLYSPQFLLEGLESADPEVKSFLLGCELEETAKEDFFGSLEL